MGLTKTRLRPAYVWTCDECGRDNFLSGIVPDLGPEEEREWKESLGIENWEEGDVIMMPEAVTCGFCGTGFETEHIEDSEGS